MNRQALFGKLNVRLFRAMESATTLCKLRGHHYVELAHWISLMAEDQHTDLVLAVRHFGISEVQLQADIQAYLSRLATGATAVQDMSPDIDLSIEHAWMQASVMDGRNAIRSGHLLMTWLAVPALRNVVLAISPHFAMIDVQQLTDAFASIVQDSPEAQEPSYDGKDFMPAMPGESSGALPVAGQDNDAVTRFCTDLTERAGQGQLDAVIGRDTDIRIMIDTLLRRRQNNVLLTGEAGVGKTALAEGLALAIARQEVPDALKQVRILSLDIGAMLAGASMKGEFEARLKNLLTALDQQPGPVILFIDEIHMLSGAGGESGTADAMNLLKPALARGQLRVIGATTWRECRQHLSKDPAFMRRFQLVQVDAPDNASALHILRRLVPVLESHHQVHILDAAVTAALRMSVRYLPDRHLPDKAISLLDTACARVALSQQVRPVALQELRARMDALDAALSMQQHDAECVTTDPDASTALTQERNTLLDRSEAMETAWHKAVSITHALLQESGDGNATQVADRCRQHAELAALQAGQVLVHPYVDDVVVAHVIADWTGIPAGNMTASERDRILALPAVLREQVVGQDHAIAQISDCLLAARSGLAKPGKPAGVFLLAGPSGVGKTETALAMCRTLFGSEDNLVTLNMSEYQESYNASSLKGAPPGYVGYGEGGVLTEAVRRKPYSVVLLDEIEKAHPDIHELFFQVFDKGWMEDGEGRNIDFTNTVIIMTSNVGSAGIAHAGSRGITASDALVKLMWPALEEHFPVAFLGRVRVIPYLCLQDDSLRQILRMQLSGITRRMQDQYQVALSFDTSAEEFVLSQCHDAGTGARMVMQVIERDLLPALGRFACQLPQQDPVLHAHVSVAGSKVMISGT